MTTPPLDDLRTLARCDPKGFLGLVEEFPQQVADGWLMGKQVGHLPPASGIDGLVVLGVGGSGISGNVLKAALGLGFQHPVRISKGYGIPGWVGPSTLVFAVSYSGDTEETLEAYERARHAGARLVAVCSGGALARLASDHGVATITVKAGLQPRAALGYLALPVLAVCQSLGLGSYEPEVTETLEILQARAAELGRSVPQKANRAKQIARALGGTIPVVYGSEGLGAVAAYRWKCQLNECSKVQAFENSFSEMTHNELVGWTHTQPGDACRMSAVLLRHSGEHPRVAERIRVTRPLLAERAAVLEEVATSATSPLARLLDLIYMGDFVATYLALQRGVDPTSIELIDRVKQELRRPPA